MSFYERYESICIRQGLEPCSQAAADKFGVTRATISIWKSRNTTPKGDTVAAIADAFGISSDYLLGRTDDPTDYSNPDLVAELSGPVLDHFDGDVKKALDFQRAVEADVAKERRNRPRILDLWERLDDVDKARVEAYLDGILTADKYAGKKTG
jgi:transcriptional regulator with XRE-family HTH domain